jgi:nucleotide-binding universal stress UspA family protein
VKIILVPIDFSPVTRSVVARAAALAGPAGAGIVILHVVQPPAVISDLDPALPVIQTMNRSAVRQLTKWRQLLEGRGLAVETECVVNGSPAHVISTEAERRSAEYVIIGSHGHGAFYDLLVGSTTSGVLKKVACPVVIVPALKRAGEKSMAAQRSFEVSGELGGPTHAVPRQSQADTVLSGTPSLPRQTPSLSVPKYAN